MIHQNNNIAKVTKCTFHMESSYQFEYIVLPITGNHHHLSHSFFVPYPQKPLKSFNVDSYRKVSLHKVSYDDGRFPFKDMRGIDPFHDINMEFFMGKLMYPWLFKLIVPVEDTDNRDYVLNYPNGNRNGQKHYKFFQRAQKGDNTF